MLMACLLAGPLLLCIVVVVTVWYWDCKSAGCIVVAFVYGYFVEVVTGGLITSLGCVVVHRKYRSHRQEGLNWMEVLGCSPSRLVGRIGVLLEVRRSKLMKLVVSMGPLLLHSVVDNRVVMDHDYVDNEDMDLCSSRHILILGTGRSTDHEVGMGVGDKVRDRNSHGRSNNHGEDKLDSRDPGENRMGKQRDWLLSILVPCPDIGQEFLVAGLLCVTEQR